MRGDDLPLGRADRRGRQPRPRGPGAHRPARGAGSEAHALCLAGDVASTGGAKDAEGYYREALALAGELGMRPLVAHCHLGLSKLYRRTAKREQAREHLTTATTIYREMDMRFWLEQAEVELQALT
jgi:Tetratricopeptide repeat